MYCYAQIDSDCNLIGVSKLFAPVDDPLMISITEETYHSLMTDFYRAKYDNGTWVEGLTQAEIDEINRAKKSETTEQKIANLQQLVTSVSSDLQALMDYLAEQGVL